MIGVSCLAALTLELPICNVVEAAAACEEDPGRNAVDSTVHDKRVDRVKEWDCGRLSLQQYCGALIDGDSLLRIGLLTGFLGKLVDACVREVRNVTGIGAGLAAVPVGKEIGLSWVNAVEEDCIE